MLIKIRVRVRSRLMARAKVKFGVKIMILVMVRVMVTVTVTVTVRVMSGFKIYWKGNIQDTLSDVEFSKTHEWYRLRLLMRVWR